MTQSFVYRLLLALAAALNALPAFTQHLGVMDKLDYHCPAVYGVVLGCKGNTCTFKVERKLWGKIPRDTIEIRNWDLKGKQTKLYT